MSRFGVACLIALAGCDSVFGVGQVQPLADAPPPDAYAPGDWSAIAAGEGYQCGIKLDGTLWCWGDNDHGQLGFEATVMTVPAPQQVGTAKWTSVRTRLWTTCGIQQDSSLWCWGMDFNGEVGDSGGADRFTPYNVPGTWREVAPGGFHTCAIDTAGASWCWGDNSYGQLGVGDFSPHPGLVAVTGNIAFTSIVDGYQHTCALAVADQTAWCWGASTNGELGDGSNVPIAKPTQVSTQAWTAITSGFNHVCARRPDGRLRCWGQNYYGQLGTQMPSTSALTPIKVGDDDVWQTVVAGGRHTCATRSDSSMWCWGYNDAGQLGTAPSTAVPMPRQVAGGPTRWATLAAGSYNTCGISDDNHLWCMGRGASSQSFVRTPTQLPGTWRTVDGGSSTTCAIDDTGALYCWGNNTSAQVGDESYTTRSSPVRIAEPSWTHVATGGVFACGIRDDGTLWCWGTNYFGLGDGSMSRASPSVIDTRKYQQLACGSTWICAIEQGTGSLYCWGGNYSYQLGTGDTMNQPMPFPVTSQQWTSITAGATHTCGVGTNGGQCWGSSGTGALGNGAVASTNTTPMPVLAATQMVTRSAHTCSVDANGVANCWGYNATGQLGDGTANTQPSPVLVMGGASWAQLSTGASHTCGVTKTGALFCWGDNSSGQLGVDVTGARATPQQVGTDLGWDQVSTGMSHTCAIRSDKSMWCWGSNYYGELGTGAATGAGPVLVP